MSATVDAPTGRRLGSAYWRLWIASGVSNIGDGVLLAALPLLAARSTHNALSVGLIATFFTIPWLFLALPVGALIDRTDRRRLLVGADMFRGALVAAVAAAAAVADVHIWMLWLLAFGLGVGEVFFDSSSQAILPLIVEAEQLEQANGWRYSVETAANTLGLPVGSVLFAVVVWLPFGVDAVSFVVAALLAVSLRGSYRVTATPSEAPPLTSLRAEMGEGLRWLWHHSLLRSLAIGLALTSLALAISEATFVLFATRQLGISERLFGPLVAVVTAGSIGAGILGSRLVAAVGRRFAILVAGITPAITMTAIGTIAVTWWVVLMITIQAAMVTIWNIVGVTLRQRLVPEHLFGRVNSVYRWFTWGAMPLGGLLGGVVAEEFGLRAPYFLGAGVALVAYAIIVIRLTEPAIDEALRAADRSGPLTPSLADDDTPPYTERDPLDDLLGFE